MHGVRFASDHWLLLRRKNNAVHGGTIFFPHQKHLLLLLCVSTGERLLTHRKPLSLSTQRQDKQPSRSVEFDSEKQDQCATCFPRVSPAKPPVSADRWCRKSRRANARNIVMYAESYHETKQHTRNTGVKALARPPADLLWYNFTKSYVPGV